MWRDPFAIIFNRNQMVNDINHIWEKAVETRDEKKIRLLVKCGVDMNTCFERYGSNALYVAVSSLDEGLVKLLLELGADWLGVLKHTDLIRKDLHGLEMYWRKPVDVIWDLSDSDEEEVQRLTNKTKKKHDESVENIHKFRRIYYKLMKARMDLLKEELVAKAFHPRRVEKWVEYGDAVFDMMFGL